jgi:hypothetical protein
MYLSGPVDPQFIAAGERFSVRMGLILVPDKSECMVRRLAASEI